MNEGKGQWQNLNKQLRQRQSCKLSSTRNHVDIASTKIKCARKARNKGKKERGMIRHAPSLPNSLVHSSFLLRSSWLIVGLELRTDLTKSLRRRGGSRSWSASTLAQLISAAPSSPGEQGVSFSAPSNITCNPC